MLVVLKILIEENQELRVFSVQQLVKQFMRLHFTYSLSVLN